MSKTEFGGRYNPYWSALHYKLSQVFLEEFWLPEPKVNLEICSGSRLSDWGDNAEAGEASGRGYALLSPDPWGYELGPGGALTSVKLGIPVAYIEAGARCYDMRMAKEISRRLIEHCSDLFFAPTLSCKRNLERGSVIGKIHLTGDTMYSSLGAGLMDAVSLRGLNSDKGFSLLTPHRAGNVDDPESALVLRFARI